jgi:hypothetical protein
MEGLWPILILWVVFALLGGARKKRPPQRTPGVGSSPEEARLAGGSMMDQMRRAMEELKRAQEEAKRRSEAGASAGGQQELAREWLEQREAKRKPERRPEPPRRRTAAVQKVERKVFLPKPQERVVRRPVRPLEDDDADKSSEDATVVSLEGGDYDEEAERLVAERRKAFDRGGRTEASAEQLTAAQLQRRASRPAIALGGAAEHKAWHDQIVAMPAAGPAAPAKRRPPLTRLADGTVRGAVVLSEILGKPLGERG